VCIRESSFFVIGHYEGAAMPTIKNRLEQILRGLRAEEVEMSAIATSGGLVMASDAPAGVPKGVLAAMAATIYKAAEVATTELKKGGVECIIAEFYDGSIIIAPIEPDGLLAVITRYKYKDGNDLICICNKINDAAEKIKGILT